MAPVIAGNVAPLERSDRVVKLFEQRAGQKLNNTLRTEVAITLCLLALLFLAWLVVLRNVIRPLLAAVAYVQTVSAGDLTLELAPSLRQRDDKVGVLAGAMQTMCSNLRAMIGQVSGRAATVLSSSADLQSNADVLLGFRAANAAAVALAGKPALGELLAVADGMAQTAENLNQLSGATAQMSLTIGQIGENSERTRLIAGEACRQTQQVVEKIRELGNAANNIGRVSENIATIAFQTNVLALNAAVEAARAGEAGRGFAVVAAEVKSLAQKAAAATENINEQVLEIQNAFMQGVTDANEITQIIGGVSVSVTSTAAAITEQAAVTESIAQTVADANAKVREVNLRVAESTQHISSKVRELTIVPASSRKRFLASGSKRTK